MMSEFYLVEFILYVRDQVLSRDFYTKLFSMQAVLDVPGMTSFQLSPFVRLGLMPSSGIVKLLPTIQHPDKGHGIPACELYLKVDHIYQSYDHAVAIGVDLLSEPLARDWGDTVFYLMDPDGHIIAFAS